MEENREFVTECYGKNKINKTIKSTEKKKQDIELVKSDVDSNNNSLIVLAIFFFVTILNLIFSSECISAKISENQWYDVADPVAAREYVDRNAKLISYYDNYHFIFLGVAVICELVAIYSIFTKNNLLGKIISILMILCNGFIIYECLII